MAKDKLSEAIWKRALGGEVEEVSDEYNIENGRAVLSKQRINKKMIAPDLAAIKLLLEEIKDEYEDMSEDELVSERDRLIGLLNKPAK